MLRNTKCRGGWSVEMAPEGVASSPGGTSLGRQSTAEAGIGPPQWQGSACRLARAWQTSTWPGCRRRTTGPSRRRRRRCRWRWSSSGGRPCPRCPARSCRRPRRASRRRPATAAETPESLEAVAESSEAMAGVKGKAARSSTGGRPREVTRGRSGEGEGALQGLKGKITRRCRRDVAPGWRD